MIFLEWLIYDQMEQVCKHSKVRANFFGRYTALPRTHLEKARNKPTITIRPTSTNMPFKTGLASNHSRNDKAKKPIMTIITRPPKIRMHRIMIPAISHFNRDMSLTFYSSVKFLF